MHKIFSNLKGFETYEFGSNGQEDYSYDNMSYMFGDGMTYGDACGDGVGTENDYENKKYNNFFYDRYLIHTTEEASF